jgi:DNA-binding LytR/AlgR family response regulator
MHNLKIVEPSDIVYLKADANYTIFNFKNGKKEISGFTLKHHQEKHELTGFLRVNRAYLLNPKYISEYKVEGKTTLICMSDGTKTRVSRRRKTLIIG